MSFSTIPETVKRIGSMCFSRCTNLKRIDFDENSKLEFIEHTAFANTALEKFVFPNRVEEIPCNCFEGCQQLRSIVLGDNSRLRSVKDYAFYGVPDDLNVHAPGELIDRLMITFKQAKVNCKFVATSDYTAPQVAHDPPELPVQKKVNMSDLGRLRGPRD